jgi:hypothetical protein
MRSKQIGHFYVVGCIRSGTTLLHCLLGTHSQIAVLPELDFFSIMYLNQGLRQRLLHMPMPSFPLHYERFLKITGAPRPRFRPIFYCQYANLYLKTLDNIAIAQGKRAWLDKTPRYVLFTNYIERHIPDAKFVHIVRNGPDTIASIYDALLKYPLDPSWDWSLQGAIRFWIQCAKASLACADRPNHYIVGYTDLVEDTERVLRRICDFLDLPFETSMLESYAQTADRIVEPFEQWKASIREPIKNRNGEKFQRLFSPELQQQILERLSEVDLSSLNIRP